MRRTGAASGGPRPCFSTRMGPGDSALSLPVSPLGALWDANRSLLVMLCYCTTDFRRLNGKSAAGGPHLGLKDG